MEEKDFWTNVAKELDNTVVIPIEREYETNLGLINKELDIADEQVNRLLKKLEPIIVPPTFNEQETLKSDIPLQQELLKVYSRVSGLANALLRLSESIYL